MKVGLLVLQLLLIAVGTAWSAAHLDVGGDNGENLANNWLAPDENSIATTTVYGSSSTGDEEGYPSDRDAFSEPGEEVIPVSTSGDPAYGDGAESSSNLTNNWLAPDTSTSTTATTTATSEISAVGVVDGNTVGTSTLTSDSTIPTSPAQLLPRVRRQVGSVGGGGTPLNCPMWTVQGQIMPCAGPYCGVYGNPPVDACVSDTCAQVAQLLASANQPQVGSFCAINFPAGWLPQQGATALCCCLGAVTCNTPSPVDISVIPIPATNSLGNSGVGVGVPGPGSNGAGVASGQPNPSGGIPNGIVNPGNYNNGLGSGLGGSSGSSSINNSNNPSPYPASALVPQQGSTASSSGVSPDTCPSPVSVGTVLQCPGNYCGYFANGAPSQKVDGCVAQACNAIYATNSPLLAANAQGGVCVSDVPPLATQGAAAGQANIVCCCAKPAWPCPAIENDFPMISYSSLFPTLPGGRR